VISIDINNSHNKNIDTTNKIDEKRCVDEERNTAKGRTPFYLTEKARKHGITRDLIELVKQAPDLMAEKTEKIHKLVELGKYQTDIKGIISKLILA
jgi:hypothetical protein